MKAERERPPSSRNQRLSTIRRTTSALERTALPLAPAELARSRAHLVFLFPEQGVGCPRDRPRLKVENILEGSVRKAGNRIRVTVQLVDAADGMQQWSEHYDRELTDVFAIQDEICHAVVDNFRMRNCLATTKRANIAPPFRGSRRVTPLG